MSQRVPFRGFIGSAFKAQSQNADSQDLINWFLQRADSPNAKSPQSLLPCPGFLTFATLPQSPVRAIFAQNNRAFAVGGDALYELDRLGGITARAMTTLTTPPVPVITNSPLTPAIDAPGTPVVAHMGTLGTTTYGYKVTAINALGETEASAEGTSAYGNATLSATNWNVVSWGAVTGATGYYVYRTTGGSAPPKLVGVVSAAVLAFNDIGTAGSAVTPPVSNTTGGVAGATTYGYKVTATLGVGETAASAEGFTLTGQATLSSTNYNIISWSPVTNAHGYKVYRTTGGSSPPTLIATIDDGATVTTQDAGQTGTSATPPTGNTTGTASIVNDGAPVFIYSSGDAGEQLLIVGGGNAYCYDLATDVLAQVVAGATFGGYIDTYFVVLDSGTSTLKVSESLDGFAWDATQVYQRTIGGDKWSSMAVTSAEIWLIGSQTSEVWVGTGDDATRFTPYQPVFIEQGIIAAYSLDRIAGTLMWVGQDADGAGVVYRTSGYTPVQVSTRAVEHSIQNLTTIADAYAFSYQQEGHTFYVLTFPSDDITWVYDVLTGEWHKRLFWDSNEMGYLAYRPQCFAFAFGGLGFGMALVGDRSTGVIAKMHPSYGSDIDGSVIRRLRDCPHVSDAQRSITYDRLAIDGDVGLGLASGQGSDPTVMLSYSNDGGNTFGMELWRSAGAQGQRKIHIAWNQLGSSEDRVFRLVVTDPVPWRWTEAWLDIEAEVLA